jgi:hypothetical protein
MEKKTAAEIIAEYTYCVDDEAQEELEGIAGKFSSLCDGNCGDGVCGQCG